jgi:hypothetical protein
VCSTNTTDAQYVSFQMEDRIAGRGDRNFHEDCCEMGDVGFCVISFRCLFRAISSIPVKFAKLQQRAIPGPTRPSNEYTADTKRSLFNITSPQRPATGRGAVPSINHVRGSTALLWWTISPTTVCVRSEPWRRQNPAYISNPSHPNAAGRMGSAPGCPSWLKYPFYWKFCQHIGQRECSDPIRRGRKPGRRESRLVVERSVGTCAWLRQLD